MAGIDIRQFQATFFAESREGLDAMEAGLLQLESGNLDAETVNTVFRAAHSIKGGAATFGFRAMTETTHLLETLLDQVRAGKRTVDTALSNVLLASVDVLRNLLTAAEEGRADEREGVDALLAQLGAFLERPTEASTPTPKQPPAPTPAPAATAAEARPGVDPSAATAPTAAPGAGWRIRFAPDAGLFVSGNDPLRILRELDALGELHSEGRLDALPVFADLDPGTSYLSWTLELACEASRAAVLEVFAWVEDECRLEIEPLTPSAETVAADTAPTPSPAQAPSPVAAIPAAPAPDIAAAAPSAAAPATTTAPAATSAAPAREMAHHDATESSIRVGIAKVDALINLVGELVITQAMLKEQSSGLDPSAHDQLLAGLAQLERNTRDLQEAVMSVRMLPVEFAFSRFPRLVRDLGARLGKNVRLRTSGEGTELDKSVIERIIDPLMHLVRNSIDHGIENPEDRIAAGKDPAGTVSLAASHQGGNIVIQVADDGRGLDRHKILAKAVERGLSINDAMPDAEVWRLIFHPGLTTAQIVTDVSGRGVGMDVVKSNIVALGGTVDVDSESGKGMRVTIRLPLTLAILDAMTVAVGAETFVLPLAYVVESLQPENADVKSVSGENCLLRVRDEYLPLMSMADLYRVPHHPEASGRRTVVVVESEGRKAALQVDELIGQQQVVVKSIESNYRKISGVSGATILGDGRVALIVDVGSVVRGMPAAA